MKLSWRSRMILHLLRWLQRKEQKIFTANFLWNPPPELGKPMVVLQVALHESDIVFTRVWMKPADARMLCTNGLGEIDKQLEQWQAYWREQKGRRPGSDRVLDS